MERIGTGSARRASSLLGRLRYIIQISLDDEWKLNILQWIQIEIALRNEPGFVWSVNSDGVKPRVISFSKNLFNGPTYYLSVADG